MSLDEFGKSVMRWGRGDAEARERIETLSAAELLRHGVTQEIAEAWRRFYENEVRRRPKNPSARGRADLMRAAAGLLE